MKRNRNRNAGELRMRIQNVIIAFIVITFMVGIVVGFYTMLYTEKRDGIIRVGELTAKESADDFSDYLSTSIDAIRLTAYAIDKLIEEGKTNEEILDYMYGQSSAIRNAIFENTTGLYGYVRGEYLDGEHWVPDDDYVATERPWYIKAVKNGGRITMIDPYLDAQTETVNMAIAKRLSQDEESVVSMDINLEEIQRITEKAVASGETEAEFILDSNREVVAHSDKAEIGKNYRMEKGTLYGKIMEEIAKDKRKNCYEFEYENSDYVAYKVRIENDWICVFVQDATDVFRSIKWIFYGTLGIIFLVVIILVMVFHNSGRKSLEAERARAASEAKSVFLSNMSHEIRTPINAMLGMNEMILRESENKNITEYSEGIRQAGNTLLGFVDDILDFSEETLGHSFPKIEEGKLENLPDEFSYRETAKGHGKSIGGMFTAPEAEVLVIDDNEMNLKVISSLLKRTKVHTDTGGSGEEALRLTREKKYDLIFLDHMMPEKDGIETLQEMRDRKNDPNKATPVICLTANAISGAREKYLEAGFDDYLTKPIDAEHLEETMMKYLPDEKLRPGTSDSTSVPTVGDTLGDETFDSEVPAYIRAIAELDVKEGIRNNGNNVDDYIDSLKIFARTADRNATEIEELYRSGDIKNTTIKIHALKSTARIIGATAIGELAERLETAGKAGDTDTLSAKQEEMLTRFRAVGEELKPILSEKAEIEDEGLPMAEKEVVEEVFARIRELVDECDDAGIEDVLAELDGYRIPEEEKKKLSTIREALDEFDFNGVREALG